MTDQNDGGPAFPHMEETNDGRVAVTNYGMSLRDWFAGKALAGLLANNETATTPSIVGDMAFNYADAMIAARKAKL